MYGDLRFLSDTYSPLHREDFSQLLNAIRSECMSVSVSAGLSAFCYSPVVCISGYEQAVCVHVCIC